MITISCCWDHQPRTTVRTPKDGSNHKDQEKFLIRFCILVIISESNRSVTIFLTSVTYVNTYDFDVCNSLISAEVYDSQKM